MYCSDCGQALVAGQAYCPRCGRASAMGIPQGMPMGPANPIMQGLPYLERRVNSLAVGWFIYAGLIALFGVMGMFFAQAALSGHLGPWMTGPWAHGHSRWHEFGGPFQGPALPLFFMKLGWLFLGLRVGLAAAAGYGLMHKTTWGRWVAIVAGILAILHVPLGTVIGIWTLLVLANARNALGYDAMAR